jgi:hypothetical protein
MCASSVQASHDFAGKVAFVIGAATARRLDCGFCTEATLRVNGGIVMA